MTREDLLAPLLDHGSALGSLLTAYFDQDWGDDHGSWNDVVVAFAADARAPGVESALSEVDRLLASGATDADVDWLLRDGLHSGFVPSVQGMTGLVALNALRDELRSLAADSAP